MCGGEQTGPGGAVRTPFLLGEGGMTQGGKKEGLVKQRETKGKNIKTKEREAKILGQMADAFLAERSGPSHCLKLRLQGKGRQPSSCSS